MTLTDLEMSSLLPRRPGRLSRCLLHLVQTFGGKTLTGYADALLGTRTFRLALGADVFKTLGLHSDSPLRSGSGGANLRSAAGLRPPPRCTKIC